MIAIFKREMSAYFTSAVGYTYLAVFYIITGIFFYMTISSGTSDMFMIFSSLFLVLIFLIPILTMRLISEEKKHKTDQALLTAPINILSLVVGKFLAAFVVFVLGLSITLLFALVFGSLTQGLDWVVVFGNYVGILLLGASFISIGILISSLTENQVIAAIGSFAVLLSLYLIDAFAQLIPIKFVATILTSISFFTKYAPFTRGIFDLQCVLFFVSVIAASLFLTTKVIERKRWS